VKVCIVTQGEYSSRDIVRVLASQEQAEAWILSLPVRIEHTDMSRYNQAKEWTADYVDMDAWHGRIGWYMTKADAEQAAADPVVRLAMFDFEEWEVG
jgi:hypothetical protein